MLSVGLILFTNVIFLRLRFKWFFLSFDGVLILLLVEFDKLSYFLSASKPNNSIGSNNSLAKGNIESWSLNLSEILYASFLFKLSVILIFFFSSESSSLFKLLFISKSDKSNMSWDSSPFIARLELKFIGLLIVWLLINVLWEAFNKLEASNLPLFSLLFIFDSEYIIDSFCWGNKLFVRELLTLYWFKLFRFDIIFNLSSFHWYFICRIFVEGDPYAVYMSPISYILSQSLIEKKISSLGIHNSLIGIKYKFIFGSILGMFFHFSSKTSKMNFIGRILVKCTSNLHE